jgi:hypothetical protein
MYDDMVKAFNGPDGVNRMLADGVNPSQLQNPRQWQAEDIAGGLTSTGARGTLSGIKDGDGSTEADIDDRS